MKIAAMTACEETRLASETTAVVTGGPDDTPRESPCSAGVGRASAAGADDGDAVAVHLSAADH